MAEGSAKDAERSHLPLSCKSLEFLKLPASPRVPSPNTEPSEVGGPSMKRTLAVNKPSSNDPLSHRIIEKRRRDRMNNCLADLSKLIPTYYLKKGRGRIEKTEIIEMAIKYMKHLQAHACNQIETCDITTKQERAGKELEHFQMGYQESMSKTLEFLRDSEGLFSGDSLCVRIMNHLTKHCEKIMRSEGYINIQLNGSNSSSSSSSSGYHANSSSTGSSSDGNGSGSNQGSDCKDGLLTEESAYRSDDRLGSDEREDMASFSSPEVSADSRGQSRHQLRENFHFPSVETPYGCNSTYLMSSELGSNNSSSGDDNAGNRLYKFKSNMKHRFSADTEHTPVWKKRKISESSYGGLTDGEEYERKITCVPQQYERPSIQDPHQDFSSGLEGRVTPNPQQKAVQLPPPMGVTKKDPDGRFVPIFALNPSGTFYIPLTIDHSLLAPAMAFQNEISPVLHPVSICVNFCTPHSFPPIVQNSSPISSTNPHRHPHSTTTTDNHPPLPYEKRRHTNHCVQYPLNSTHSTSPTISAGEKREHFSPLQIKTYRHGNTSEFYPMNREVRPPVGHVTSIQRDQREHTPRPNSDTHLLLRDHHNTNSAISASYNVKQAQWHY